MTQDNYSLTTSYHVADTQIITHPRSAVMGSDTLEQRKGTIDLDLDALSHLVFSETELEVIKNRVPENTNEKKLTTNAANRNHVQFDANWNFVPEGKVSVLHASIEGGTYAFIDLQVERQFEAGKILLHVSRTVDGHQLVQLFLMPNNWKENNSSLVFNINGQELASIGRTGLDIERTMREVSEAFGGIDFGGIDFGTLNENVDELYQRYRKELFQVT